MSETKTIRDPFLGKDVKISTRLVDRLRGRYALGPTMENGEPEFGWRQMPTVPVQVEAAKCIDDMKNQLRAALTFLEDECCGDRSDPAAEGTYTDEARKLSDRIAAVIKQATGEV